ncbi:phosphodiester glycosidase family protein [Leptodesmis sp.]|uniref:phosphodiester glycosidase family protein n=1 Tax=Leptodesmis sp. TaxID=3100501 RepID=UPI004053502E
MAFGAALVGIVDGSQLHVGMTERAIAQPLPTFPSPTPAILSPTQMPVGAATVQQGAQITLNGRSIAVAWMQWRSPTGDLRTGITDAGLQSIMGIQFLNTDNVAQQPFQWFASTASLPTRLTSSLRYLDITDLAQQAGWQVQATPETLQIVTPAAKVIGIRQSKQSWGDRWVIQVDRSIPWQTDFQGQELVLTLEAQIDPALVQPLKPNSGTDRQSLKLESISTHQSRLRLTLPSGLRPRVWSTSAPDRIVVDIRPDSLVEQNILWAPGLRWRQQIVTVGNRPMPVQWLEVNPRQPGLSMKPIAPNPTSMLGTALLAQTATQNQVAAAINGGFFNRNRQLPLGAIRQDGQWLSGPVLNRGAIAWDTSGNALFDRLTLQETLMAGNGQRLPLTHLNSGYLQAGMARYTNHWGPTYTPLSDNEIVVTVQNNQVSHQQAIAKAGTSPVPIPTDGYLLVLRSNQAAASLLPAGTPLQLESATNPPTFNQFPQIIGAGPLLIQNGQIVLNPQAEGFSQAFITETAPRSAIGQTANGTFLLVTAYNRLDGTELSLMDMAQLMQQLGAIAALNLDGGSSSTLFLGGEVRDRPPRTAARVHNGIGIFLAPNP